ncbi:MAG: YybH family protein, partial [Limnohabitans sp.]
VLAWAKAWSRKDMDDYLQAYAGSFVPPEGQSRSKWEAERKLRIVSKKSISVEVRQLKVTVEDKTATVQFQQIYSSDNFAGNSRKTLEMVRQGDRWLIARERVN